MRSDIARTINLASRQAELYALLERQARLYTMGDSSSMPEETARELLHSIRYTLQAALDAGAPADHSLEELLRLGGLEIWRLVEEARRLYAAVRQTDPGYGSIALRDTMEAVDGFFRVYDLRFFAQDIPCMIDYPLTLPVEDALEGISFIGEYLRRLLLEHRFCRCVPSGDAAQVLHRFQPEYRELVLNLFQPLLHCALGRLLLGKEPAPPVLSPADCKALYALFHPWREAEARTLLEGAAHRLCAHLRLWDSAMRGYLAAAAESLLPQLMAAGEQGYSNLFCAR